MTHTRRLLFASLAALGVLLAACGGGEDAEGITAEENLAIRNTIDVTAWALMLVLPDAATVEAHTGIAPAAFHVLEYDAGGRLLAAAVDIEGVPVATFDLHLAAGAAAERAEGAMTLGRFSVATTVHAGEMPEAAAGALNLAALVNAQRIIDINYTPPATPASLDVGLNLLDAFEAAGREWQTALAAGDASHEPRVLGTCEETRQFERGLWMFIARPCLEYGRGDALLSAGDTEAALVAVREAVERTVAVSASMRAALD
ncbi:MAG: hypothetical protein AMXMBFR23_20020 [Chloroflexota bacterium]